MAEAGLPVIPGCDMVADTARRRADGLRERIGYPLLLKARSGGGGRGIRLVDTPRGAGDRLPGGDRGGRERPLATARSTWKSISDPAKHIEVQILADEQGNVVCLGERDCSVQRKNQKLIEETPLPGRDAGAAGASMFELAARAAQGSWATWASGRWSFCWTGEGNFYFMEMNVRLQVEHTVTEVLTEHRPGQVADSHRGRASR